MSGSMVGLGFRHLQGVARCWRLLARLELGYSAGSGIFDHALENQQKRRAGKGYYRKF
jgi:hypothetical protein